MEELEVIGIDHGNRNMKTVHTVFETAISELREKPSHLENVLEYQGRYFVTGGERVEEKIDKTVDDDFYFLTLVALARELRERNKNRARVVIAAGLPIKWFQSQKKDFQKYLLRARDLNFQFEGIGYSVTIERVSVYMQGYAAIAEKVGQYKGFHLMVDIGGGTIDIVPINNGIPQMDRCKIDTKAAIWCINEVNERLTSKFGWKAEESQIQDVMIHGEGDYNKEYLEVIQEAIRNYTRYVYNLLTGFRYNLQLSKVTFLGGGAHIMYNFADYNKENTAFILDIKANAKGFESTENQMIRMRNRKMR